MSRLRSRFTNKSRQRSPDTRIESYSEPRVEDIGNPFLLKEEQVHDRTRLKSLVETINAAGGTYHQLNLLPDLCVQGDYDMRRYVGAYGIPEDLTGLAVLDVGTAAGYLALECARRGGQVTAVDVWESTPVGEIAECAALNITYVKKSIYDLDASFGTFDIVVCGSLLLHLPDQFGAISALRSVCRGRLCVSTNSTVDSGSSDRPVCDFVAQKAAEGDYHTFWLLSEAALQRLLLTAGFARVDNTRHFLLETNEGRRRFATPHVVMSAYVESSGPRAGPGVQ